MFVITPDRGLDNTKVELLPRTLTTLWTPLISRWNGRGFDAPASATWEAHLTPGATRFILTVPTEFAQVIHKAAGMCWPHSTITTTTTDPLPKMEGASAAGILELKEHFMFRLRVDRRTLSPLTGILECLELLNDGERAHIQVLITPAAPDWQQAASSAYESFRKGTMPKRLRLDGAGLANYALRGLTSANYDMLNLMQVVLGSEQTKPEFDGIDKARMLRDGPMGSHTPAKVREDAFDVTIRLAVKTNKPATAQAVLRSIAFAFRELDEDNSLLLRAGDPAQVVAAMQARHHRYKVNPDYLCVSELARLLQMPTGPLQEQYKLASIDHRETKLPAVITGGGLLIGTVKYHGQTSPVYIPTNNLDELCLPRVIIGGMGCGKTRGFGGNLGVNAVKAGFPFIAMDPGKGELGDELEAGLPPEKVVRFRFGKDLICPDWREAIHGEKAQNRAANELVWFVDAASDEAGAQTVRYLRSAARVVPDGNLLNVMRMFTDVDYLRSMLPAMEEVDRANWQQFLGAGEGRRIQIAGPVLNRLDCVLGDSYLQECMHSSTGVDLISLLDGEPRAIVFDIPKEDLGEELVDVLGAWILSKCNLAMGLRKDKERPCFIYQDEPHHYCKSAKTWRRLTVESRKYRFGFCWAFHSWEMIPRDVGEIIRSAICHYHLFTSSPATYQTLSREIAPFTVDEARRTPTHSAINIIRANGDYAPPFMAVMSPPPSLSKSNQTQNKGH